MKNIIATLNQLEQSLAQLNPESLSAIELDIALAKLRSLYERLLFVEVAEEQEDVQDSVIELIEEVENVPENEESTVEEETVEEEPEAEQEPVVEPEAEQEPEPKEEEPVAPKGKLAHKVVLSLYDDEEELPAAPATEEPTVEEPTVEEISVNEPEESVIELIEELIEEVEDMPEADDEEEPVEEELPAATEPATEEELAEPEEAPAVEEPAEEECEIAPAEEETPAEDEEEEAPVVIDFAQEEPQMVVLGDVLGGEQTTVADAIAVSAGPDVATVAAAGEVSLMKAVSLNDKMLLVRELFGGDSRLYEQSMEVLDSYESLDEAMLFIYDNFDWNPNSEGAKLLVDLLMRKLL